MADANDLIFSPIATAEAVQAYLEANRATILANNAAFRESFGSFASRYVTGFQVGPSEDGLYLGFRFNVVGRDPVEIAIPASMFGVFCNEIALAMNMNMERLQAAFCPPEGNA